MPMFSLSVLEEDQELTPTVTAEFDDWSDVSEYVAEVCTAIYQSGICNAAKSTARLIVEGTDGSTRMFDIVNGGVPVERSRHDVLGPNLIRCLHE